MGGSQSSSNSSNLLSDVDYLSELPPEVRDKILSQPQLGPEHIARNHRVNKSLRVAATTAKLHATKEGAGLTIPFCAGEICSDPKDMEWGGEAGRLMTRCIQCNDIVSIQKRIIANGFEAASAHRMLVEAVDSTALSDQEKKAVVCNWVTTALEDLPGGLLQIDLTTRTYR